MKNNKKRGQTRLIFSQSSQAHEFLSTQTHQSRFDYRYHHWPETGSSEATPFANQIFEGKVFCEP